MRERLAGSGAVRAGPPSATLRERGVRRRGLVAGATMAVLISGALVTIATRGDAAGEAPPQVEAPAVPTEPGATPPSVVIPLEPDPQELDEPRPADERAPTASDAGAFAAAHRPDDGRDVQSVTVDLDGDGWSEVLVAAVVEDVATLEVAAWDGQAYEVVFGDRAGAADALTAFEVIDVTGDGAREILIELAGPQRQALALWEVGPEGVRRQTARGGCWDGSHVYGSTGAAVEEDALVATCDAAEDPARASGEQDVYRWDGQRWAYERTEAP